ncbi:MAG: GNAT family N-acetyltransferase [Clostridia bacterium]|nr:GNAT family N-acetyltransferase [Clostridia bacterium]
MDYTALFNSMFPDFFSADYIRQMPPDWAFTELVMDLRETRPEETGFQNPGGVTFGVYEGEIEPLRAAVARVDESWVRYFGEGSRVFCAFDGDGIVSFCILSDWGCHQGLRVGGPGCVGTVPKYREKGIGLEMVRRATEILRGEGFDLSWIHYTHLARWYAKLGYRRVLTWNGKGFIPDGER